MIQQELDTIKQAILNEIEGYEFYQLAAGQTDNEEAKRALKNLAAEEMKHAEWLQQLFQHLKNGAHDQYNLAMISDPPSPQLYKWDKVREKTATSSMSVFSIGMQMEKQAIDFYQHALKSSNNDNVKALFTKLIEWEKVHHELFAKEYETLRKEWWDTQHFASF